MFTVCNNSLPDAWYTVLRAIHETGELNTTEYGNKSRFINGVAIEINDFHYDHYHKADPFCSASRLAEYKKQFTRGFKHNFDYTYMDRFTMFPTMQWDGEDGEFKNLDQLCVLREILSTGKKDESKRLQLVTWHPLLDMLSEHPPCLQSIWLYPLRSGEMDVHIRYRSWDWFQAAESNVIAIMDMLKREVFEPCNYELRYLRAWGDNVHYYLENEDQVKRVLYG
jgi:thymidylate synthase